MNITDHVYILRKNEITPMTVVGHIVRSSLSPVHNEKKDIKEQKIVTSTHYLLMKDHVDLNAIVSFNNSNFIELRDDNCVLENNVFATVEDAIKYLTEDFDFNLDEYVKNNSQI